MSLLRPVVVLCLLLAPAGLVSAEGVRGVGPDGRPGWLHTVRTGDTLWDITDTYLGTPWIWPSIWKENGIENPHLIYPDDLIWITERGMRKVTPEEAGALVAAAEVPAAPGPEPEPPALPAPQKPDPFASLDGVGSDVEQRLFYPGLHRAGFVSAEEFNSSGSILGSHDESYWTSQERTTIASLGAGDTRIGDTYTAYRVTRRVRHPETAAIVGYFIEILGIAEVTEIHEESSFMKVLSSYSEIEPGDRLIAFEDDPEHFAVSAARAPVQGVIIAHQAGRQYAAQGDLVILDRGANDGVMPGVQLQIYRAGKRVSEPNTLERLLVPDHLIGQLFVLRSGSHTSVALVRRFKTEIRVGDHFRSL